MQEVIVIACVLAAAAYLGWQFYQRFFKVRGKCDGCGISRMEKK